MTTSYLIPAIERPFQASITLPGSKSIALRQLAIAAVTEGETRIRGVPPCDDADAMLDCVAKLGARVEQTGTEVVVVGPMNYDRDVVLNARMSGASTRLLLGLAALREGRTTIDGHSSLRARTNAPLLDVLAQHGCKVKSTEGCLPVTIQGPIHPPTQMHIDGSLSSQYVTALLVTAPLLAQTQGRLRHTQTIVIDGDLVSRPYIDITLNEMAKRGIQAHWVDEQTLEVTRGAYTPGSVQVEGDATAATYFAALATLHKSEVTLTNLGADSKQGDYGFLSIMEQLGATVTREADATLIRGPEQIQPLPVLDMTEMPDAALTLIALTPLLTGGGEITGLSSLHHKECDRLECPAKEFGGLGIEAHTTEDSIRIEPATALQAHQLNTYHDHRMAMAFSIIGSVSGTLTVDDKAVVDKTYPAYWEDYAKLC